MTRVTSSPPSSFITTVITSLLLLAVGSDLLDGLGVKQPICLASVPVTTAYNPLPRSTVTTVTTDASRNKSLNQPTNHGTTKRASRTERRNRQQQNKDDLSLWIDQQQVKMFSGELLDIFILYVIYCRNRMSTTLSITNDDYRS